MKVAIKYLICLAGFWAAFASVSSCGSSVGSGITAAGAFIAFALLEINDLKILNEEDKD